MTTPDEILDRYGVQTNAVRVGDSSMTKGYQYAVTLTVGGRSETFDYHGSLHDRETGAEVDPADVLGCLLMDASYGDADPDDLYHEMGEDRPPSYYVNLADALREQRDKMVRLFGADLLDDGVDW